VDSVIRGKSSAGSDWSGLLVVFSGVPRDFVLGGSTNSVEDTGQRERVPVGRGELSYLAPLGSEIISAPYFKQCFFRGVLPPPDSQTPRLPVPRQK